jgi:Virulence activator alpha C-term
MFFLWLLEPDEARAQLEREHRYWRGILDELETIREQPSGPTRKERAFRLSLEGGIRVIGARVEWLEETLAQEPLEEGALEEGLLEPSV